MFWLSGVLTWCKWETEFEVRKSTLHWTVPSMPFFMQVLLKKRTEETNKVLFYGKAINSLNTDPVTYYTKTLGMKVKCTNSETEFCTLLCQLLESLEQRQCHGRAHSTLLGPSYKFFNIHFINAFDFYKSTILDYFHIVIKNFFLVPFEWKGDYWTFSNECYLCNNNLFWNETFFTGQHYNLSSLLILVSVVSIDLLLGQKHRSTEQPSSLQIDSHRIELISFSPIQRLIRHSNVTDKTTVLLNVRLTQVDLILVLP